MSATLERPRRRRVIPPETTNAASPGEQGAYPIAVMVSPGRGWLRVLPPRSFRNGREWVDAGQPVVRIERRRDHDLIRSPVPGRLGGVLAREGEPVKPGQAVAWVEPA